MKNNDVFTTSDVATICRVSTRIVTKWFDNKMLDGYRLPGSKHRRFTYKNIRSFMDVYEMPVERLDEFVQERAEKIATRQVQRRKKADIASAAAI